MDSLETHIDRYVALIDRYRHTLDLISEEGRRHLDRHIEDARRYALLIERLAGPTPTVVDVGSGVGLPGIIVAAALPEAQVTLVERRRRRTAFLDLARAALELDNVAVFGGDVRSLDGVCADVITAQAVAEVDVLIALTRHLHRDPCHVISRRGDGWRDHLDAAWRSAGLLDGDPDFPAENPPAGAEVVEESLEPRGSLVALRLPGGSACQSSA